MHRRKGNRPAERLLSGSCGRASCYAPGSNQIDLHRIIHPQEQRARIFHSPLRIGNREVNRRAPTARRPLHFGGHGDLAVYSVDVEPAVHSYRRRSLRRNRALNSVRTKRNFRIALALRDLVVLRSRLALPLLPLLASTTISAPIVPEAGSSSTDPCFN